MPDTTLQTFERFKALGSAPERAPEQREDAFERGKNAARQCIESGIAIHLKDEAPGLSETSDSEAMGWNSMVFSEKNKLLNTKLRQ